jgi:flagellar biosynthesis protein FlhF
VAQKKVITAPTMAQALAQVKREFGADALILNSEELPGLVRLTASNEGSWPNIAPKSSSAQKSSKDSNQTKTAQDKSHQVPFTRKDFKTFQYTNPSYSEALTAISAVCDICDFHQLGDALGEAWLQAMNPEFGKNPILLAPALGRVIGTSPQWMENLNIDRQAVLIGPPGSGKTVTIAKLAAMLTERGKKVKVVTLDIFKASGARQLEGYLQPLNLPLRVGPEHLPSDTSGNEIVLVDTPALNIRDHNDIDYLNALAEKIAVPFTLVLSADMNPAEAEEIALLYKNNGAKTLIATRLDHVRRFGTLLRAAHMHLKITLTSQSPELAEGLQVATPLSLLERLMETCEVIQR